MLQLDVGESEKEFSIRTCSMDRINSSTRTLLGTRVQHTSAVKMKMSVPRPSAIAFEKTKLPYLLVAPQLFKKQQRHSIYLP